VHFFSYSSSHVQYLNPSIREFVASVVSEDSDIAERPFEYRPYALCRLLTSGSFCTARPSSTTEHVVTVEPRSSIRGFIPAFVWSIDTLGEDA